MPWAISWRWGLGQQPTWPSKLPFLSVSSVKTLHWTNALLFSNRSISYYKRAAELGDKRAAQRLKGSTNQPQHQPGGPGSVLRRGDGDGDGDGVKGAKDKECVIM